MNTLHVRSSKATLQACHGCIHSKCFAFSAVSLSLGGTTLANNSVVVIADIGDGRAVPPRSPPLICTTTFTPCCGTQPNRHGEWYYPDGTMVQNKVMSNTNIYRDRTDNGTDTDGSVRLNRRNGNARTPTGIYICTLPGVSAEANETLLVGVYTDDSNGMTEQCLCM